MANNKPGKATKPADEMAAMTVVYEALSPLDTETQRWILRSLIDRFRLGPLMDEERGSDFRVPESDIAQPLPDTQPRTASAESPTAATATSATSGISPVAQKWMIRSGLDSGQLGAIFSLGFDEIDLVAQTVPGRGKKAKMRSVLLLKCMAAYLGTGVARVPHEKAKEACTHYGAYDPNNFAWYLKSFAREIGGAKETGYTLTAAGLTEATSLIKSMTGSSSSAKGK